MIRTDDLEHCRAVIRTGSLSFHAASKLLPSSVRDPALALYAFCRLADDEVDEGSNKGQAVLNLQDRLDRVYVGTPKNAPEDRAFAAVCEEFDMHVRYQKHCLKGLHGTRLNDATTLFQMCDPTLLEWHQQSAQ